MKTITQHTTFTVKGTTITYENWQEIGEKLLKQSLKYASLMFTKTSLSCRLLEASDDHFLFVQSSGLDYTIEQFGLEYDAPTIRNTFNRYFGIK